MRLSVSISAICSSYSVLGILIVRVNNFMQTFEENSPFAAYKTALLVSENITEVEFRNFPARFTFSAIIYQLVKLGGMSLKIERILIHCIVVVLAKTCFKKIVPKVRRLSSQFIPGKNSRSPYLANYYTYRKNIFLMEVNLMHIYILRKSQFRYIEPFQRER